MISSNFTCLLNVLTTTQLLLAFIYMEPQVTLLYQQCNYYHYHHFTDIIQDNLHQLAPQLRTGRFCWSKVLLPAYPC